MAYTDIIFHMKDMRNNLKWKKANTSFVNLPNGMLDFAENFALGMPGFCEFRNAIPINKILLERMQTKVEVVPEYKSFQKT